MGPGGQREDDTESSVAGISPHTTRLFGAVTPEPDNTLDPTARGTDPDHFDAPQPRLEKEPLDTKRIRSALVLQAVNCEVGVVVRSLPPKCSEVASCLIEGKYR